MNKTQTFAQTDPSDVKSAAYQALKLIDDGYLKLLSCGHPGGTVPFAQAGAPLVVAGADMRQLREAYSEADTDAAVLLVKSNVCVIAAKPVHTLSLPCLIAPLKAQQSQSFNARPLGSSAGSCFAHGGRNDAVSASPRYRRHSKILTTLMTGSMHTWRIRRACRA